MFPQSESRPLWNSPPRAQPQEKLGLGAPAHSPEGHLPFHVLPLRSELSRPPPSPTWVLHAGPAAPLRRGPHPGTNLSHEDAEKFPEVLLRNRKTSF